MFIMEFWGLVTKRDSFCLSFFTGSGRADREGSEVILMRPTHPALETVCGFSCLTFEQHLPWRPRFWRQRMSRQERGEHPRITWKADIGWSPYHYHTLKHSALEASKSIWALSHVGGGRTLESCSGSSECFRRLAPPPPESGRDTLSEYSEIVEFISSILVTVFYLLPLFLVPIFVSHFFFFLLRL